MLARAPLGLELGVHLSLGVVPNRLDVDEAADIELLGPEHRHVGRLIWGGACRL